MRKNKQSLISLSAFILSCIFLFSFHAPVKAATLSLDDYQRNNMIVEEITSNNVITENKADEKAYPASITKLLTALVVLEHFNVKDEITVGDEVSTIPSDSSRAWIASSDTLTVYDLLAGMLLPSGNDVAVTFAVATARKVSGNNSLSTKDAQKAFVSMMNDKAKTLGMKNSNFTNPHGYDDKNNYTTARDLLLLGKAVVANSTIMEICKKTTYTCKSQNRTYTWYSTDIFLYDKISGDTPEAYFDTSGTNQYYNPNVLGLKTGNTDLQGHCFMFYYVKDDVKMMGVILNNGKDSVWKKTSKMINFFANNYVHQEILPANTKDLSIKIPNVDYKNSTKITLGLESSVLTFVHKDDVNYLSFQFIPNSEYFELRDETKPNYYLKKDIPTGETVATIKVMCSDREVYSRDLTYEKDLKVATFKDYFIRYSPFGFIILLMIGVIVLAFVYENNRQKKRRRRKRKKQGNGAVRQVKNERKNNKNTRV